MFDEPGAGLDEHESQALRDAIARIPACFDAQVHIDGFGAVVRDGEVFVEAVAY